MTECPVCDQEYADRTIIKTGTHWKDLYPGTLYDYLTRYRRQCTASIDVEKTTVDDEPRKLRQGETAIYFHDDSRKRATV